MASVDAARENGTAIAASAPTASHRPARRAARLAQIAARGARHFALMSRRRYAARVAATMGRAMRAGGRDLSIASRGTTTSQALAASTPRSPRQPSRPRAGWRARAVAGARGRAFARAGAALLSRTSTRTRLGTGRDRVLAGLRRRDAGARGHGRGRRPRDRLTARSALREGRGRRVALGGGRGSAGTSAPFAGARALRADALSAALGRAPGGASVLVKGRASAWRASRRAHGRRGRPACGIARRGSGGAMLLSLARDAGVFAGIGFMRVSVHHLRAVMAAMTSIVTAWCSGRVIRRSRR